MPFINVSALPRLPARAVGIFISTGKTRRSCGRVDFVSIAKTGMPAASSRCLAKQLDPNSRRDPLKEGERFITRHGDGLAIIARDILANVSQSQNCAREKSVDSLIRPLDRMWTYHRGDVIITIGRNAERARLSRVRRMYNASNRGCIRRPGCRGS